MSTSNPSSSGSDEKIRPITTAPRTRTKGVNDDADNLCIETVTGKLINPIKPDVNSICVDDIAWALSRIPRFAGHTITEIPYNVAQHSVHVSILVENLVTNGDNELVREALGQTGRRELLLKALFHDGHEAYIGDIPSPVKKVPEFRSTFRELEWRLDNAIFEHLGLVPMFKEEADLIKHCDKLAQAIEGYQFMPSRGRKWGLPQPTLVELQEFSPPMSAMDSYTAFLDRYEYLRAQ